LNNAYFLRCPLDNKKNPWRDYRATRQNDVTVKTAAMTKLRYRSSFVFGKGNEQYSVSFKQNACKTHIAPATSAVNAAGDEHTAISLLHASNIAQTVINEISPATTNKTPFGVGLTHRPILPAHAIKKRNEK
jgi:hypothetical protein